MEMTLCIISLCLNAEWSLKCKYGIKSAWGFLTSAQWWYLAAITISCCLHELDLFRQYEPLYLMPIKAIWTWVRENMMRERDTESVFLSVFRVVLFGQNIKSTAEQQACSVCITSHTSMRTRHLYTHNPSAHTQSHKCSKSFIHLLC